MIWQKKKPKDFWKSIKNTFKKKSTTSDKLTAADLFDHFKSVIGNEQDSTEDHDFSLNNENLQNEYLDSEISENEIKCAVFSQKNNKSTGTDQLCAELFKAAYDIISPFLLVLFNRLLSNSEYPRLWGEGIIVPIFKGENPDEAGNYRGITLINILGKIYSQILLNRLNKWAEREKKILDTQFGFQKGKSTIDCIFTLHSIIAKTLDAGEKLYCIFIDYEKAFDKIDRSLLWQKLLKEDVSVKLVKALCSMYTVVKSCIRYHSCRSRFFQFTCWVKARGPQFSTFVHDVYK